MKMEWIEVKPTCCQAEEELKDTNKGESKHLPVAIIGAGPVGLAAAAHLARYDQPFIILESGSQVGANILTWGHVRVFSPWRYNIDESASKLLKKQGWIEPDLNDLPTGKDLVDQYLKPLANTSEIKNSLFVNTKVLSISRKNMDKMKTANREKQPFVIYAEQNREFKQFEARAVIDATGTWGNPNPANSNGIWLKEEKAIFNQTFYGIPDILGVGKSRYLNKCVAVIGSGHSAINSLLELAKLKEEYPATEIIWVLRKVRVEEAYGGEELDALEARGDLGSRIHKLVDSGVVQVITPFRIQNIKGKNGKIELVGETKDDLKTYSDIDEMIVNTGNRPDFSILREVRTSIDTATESVKALAPLIDPNIHSCGTVRPHGEKELRQPEKDFYIVGAKSYGRAPTFLMATGYEQVRSVVAYLSGDYEASEKVELELPETGVCSTNQNVTKASCSSNSCC
ncbi:glutamate synthase [Heyndrickxia sporothermodurans]|uniref:NAD(P)-binding domain-containing protein n=3 Tax=Heyndrickxia sporothermodurans TaxID=46224 RepID=A0AB37HG74_9BACI|nr:NAD(P)-binding domain-containing protein [Heyndrickxia sporothermodurans]MBL5767376.1 NAD(P)-binding domain-containing protein [Heyndrickxia sporothermodurans]MBL5770849.1 NAD(P)-binding domain-containing protein [Heyndrickxia sporothermodurans]MBL5774489.1 NAD(P)-binding domain-containing protein [Heyndrickxia sporothermodurans]MBL5776945.1 NAD(P)-binding domain-containing protein [Heyndrickxia sporothermodurans]MBL5781576.1 NAD(P)-binding domain-containing protein [Heyndrickxia sporotherm